MPHTVFCVRVRARDLRQRLYDAAPGLCLPPVDGFLRDALCLAIAEGLDDASAMERAALAAEARALVEGEAGSPWNALAAAVRAVPAAPVALAA